MKPNILLARVLVYLFGRHETNCGECNHPAADERLGWLGDMACLPSPANLPCLLSDKEGRVCQCASIGHRGYV